MPGGKRGEAGCEGGGGGGPEAEVDSLCLEAERMPGLLDMPVSVVWYVPDVRWVDSKQVLGAFSLDILRTLI